MRFGRPSFVLVAALSAIYYVAISLTSSTYDTQRWSYSHFSEGAFLLAIQLVLAAIADVTIRHRTRPTS